jgi:hypothetical protein
MSLQQWQLFMTSMLLLPLPPWCALHVPPLFRTAGSSGGTEPAAAGSQQTTDHSQVCQSVVHLAAALQASANTAWHTGIT